MFLFIRSIMYTHTYIWIIITIVNFINIDASIWRLERLHHFLLNEYGWCVLIWSVKIVNEFTCKLMQKTSTKIQLHGKFNKETTIVSERIWGKTKTELGKDNGRQSYTATVHPVFIDCHTNSCILAIATPVGKVLWFVLFLQ